MVNASREAVASHSTSPAAIRELLERGVEVYSLAQLHAKVITTADYAVIGSANASANSEMSDEAVVITDQKSVVREARSFIDALIADADISPRTITSSRCGTGHRLKFSFPGCPAGPRKRNCYPAE